MIGVAVAEPWAKAFVERSIRHESADAIPLDDRGTRVTGKPACSAIVYDLHPWDGGVTERIAHLTEGNPSFPLLLYVPANPNALAAANESGVAGRHRLQIQTRDNRGLDCFRRDLHSLINALPTYQVMQLVMAACPSIADWSHLFAHHVLRTLARGRRPTASATADALGLSIRTLERRLQANQLPQPKEFIDWMTLLYVAALAECRRMSLAKAAHSVRLNSNDLYRLRCRMLGRSTVFPRNDLLSQVVLAFAVHIKRRQTGQRRTVFTCHANDCSGRVWTELVTKAAVSCPNGESCCCASSPMKPERLAIA